MKKEEEEAVELTPEQFCMAGILDLSLEECFWEEERNGQTAHDFV